ncbi:MAG TPA: hypothetical protein VHN74_17675 [Candidatus Angelobacter sp.]|jgi:predicted metal-dependent phosphotriesterase family hydrolase|nr:hypothetical protein [Candidatus Angelobacter sp.]
MMSPGSIDGNNNWVESTSLARAIEDAMVRAGVIKLDKESKSTTHDRRNSFVAIATGLINYLQANLEIHIGAGTLGAATGNNVPAAAVTLTQAVK